MTLIYRLLVGILIFATVVISTDGVSLDNGFYSLILGGLGFGFVMGLSEFVIDYFRLKKSVVAYVVASLILSLLYFFTLKTLVYGILDFDQTVIGGAFGPIIVPEFELNSETNTVIFVSIYAGVLTLILDYFDKRR